VADLLGDVDDAALEAPERHGVERGMFDPLAEEPRIAEDEQIIAEAAVSGGPAKIPARSLMGVLHVSVNGDGANARPGQRLREPRAFLHGAVEGEDLREPVLFDRFAQRPDLGIDRDGLAGPQGRDQDLEIADDLVRDVITSPRRRSRGSSDR
jgi:hypothetical protein